MRKRVLLAEGSDTVRSLAESTLRQNGYEVISVASGEKALEVMEFSKPDLIIVGSDLFGKGRQPVYEHCQEDSRVSSVPLLLLADPGESSLPFPQEVIINRPFEPKELLDKVNVFAGSPAAASPDGSSNPLSDAQLGEDALDAALGLDQIDVTDSEVMDKTQVPANQKKPAKPPEKLVGYDSYDDDDETKSGKVESLLIRDEDAEIGNDDSKKEGKSMSQSGKLEILNDQYGLIDSDAADLDSEDKAHDYNWFVDALRKDADSFPGSESKPEAKDKEPQGTDLTFSDPSQMVDPVTPPPDSGAESEQPEKKGAGVDKFIDEFKEEIKKIRSDEPESITIGDGAKGNAKSQDGLGWQDSLEKTTPEEIGVFTQQFIRELADRVAQLIAGKIDQEKLLNLLKREIIEQIKKNQK